MGEGGILRGPRLSVTHALCLQGILLCKKLSNKHMTMWFLDLLGL